MLLLGGLVHFNLHRLTPIGCNYCRRRGWHHTDVLKWPLSKEKVYISTVLRPWLTYLPRIKKRVGLKESGSFGYWLQPGSFGERGYVTRFAKYYVTCVDRLRVRMACNALLCNDGRLRSLEANNENCILKKPDLKWPEQLTSLPTPTLGKLLCNIPIQWHNHWCNRETLTPTRSRAHATRRSKVLHVA